MKDLVFNWSCCSKLFLKLTLNLLRIMSASAFYWLDSIIEKFDLSLTINVVLFAVEFIIEFFSFFEFSRSWKITQKWRLWIFTSLKTQIWLVSWATRLFKNYSTTSFDIIEVPKRENFTHFVSRLLHEQILKDVFE